MCGRYTLTARGVEVSTFFGLESVPELPARYNVAPGQTVPAVREAAGGGLELASMRWGLVPAWSKEPSPGYSTINACCETAADRPAYRAAYRRRRCLLPADGFYEWKKSGKARQPFHFSLKGRSLFALAGLWEEWSGADGASLTTSTVLTTRANTLVLDIHPRMPVILRPEDHALWLTPEKCTHEVEERLFRPYSADEMKVVAVDTWVNNARHEGPRCLSPLVELPFA